MDQALFAIWILFIYFVLCYIPLAKWSFFCRWWQSRYWVKLRWILGSLWWFCSRCVMAIWRDKEIIAQGFGINFFMAGNDSKLYIFEFTRKALCTEFFLKGDIWICIWFCIAQICTNSFLHTFEMWRWDFFIYS